MRTLAVDGRMGASGDMLLGALLAVGADPETLAPVEDALPVEYVVETVDKEGIAATKVTVEYTDQRETEHGHEHDHAHTHGHGLLDRPGSDALGGGDGHAHDHAEGHGPTRTLGEIEAIVEEMDLPERVESDATATFRLLAEAEASVHGTDLETTHVHEVGADDAIADIVGVAVLLNDLDVEQVVVTPVKTGAGEVEMAHGTYPIPPPAVAEIASRADWTVEGGPVDAELLTPTGAALLAHFGNGVESLPTMTVEEVGYGAGARDFPGRPNVLRVLLGETESKREETALTKEPIAVVETTVDDVSPEVLGSLHETLEPVGARDVAILSATMKKSRPGHLVQVICMREDAPAVAKKLAAETGSLGVRVSDSMHRWIASRRVETVELEIAGEIHEVDVKVASDAEGAVYDVSAEFDDALAVAKETGLAVRDVMKRAEAAVED